MGDDFYISGELWQQLKNLAEEQGVLASELLNSAVKAYIQKNSRVDMYAVLSAADACIRKSAVFAIDVDIPGTTLIVKSPLQYVHRPAIKYLIKMERNDPRFLGRFSVVLRSHEIRTQQYFSEFLSIWISLEQRYFMSKHRLQAIGRQPDITSFQRGLYRIPVVDSANSQKIGVAIGEYLSVFDTLLKLYFNAHCDGMRIEQEYLCYLQDGKLNI